MQNLLKKFLALESLSGILIFAMAIIAMIWANSSFAPEYQQLTEQFLSFINEGLMAIFFLVVGLELKRGLLDGGLASLTRISLPLTAAVGGMLVPALVYWYVNEGNNLAQKGWAIPTATDIAFALAVASFFGKRVPEQLKLFLLALAVFDDIGAIIIIAGFFSQHLSYLMLILASIILFSLYLFRCYFVNWVGIYLVAGILLWLCLHHSGIHPTIAGVLLALSIPNKSGRFGSPLKRIEGWLHPWVAYFIMPLFALANAGVSLHGMTLPALFNGVVLGIALGLVVGKQIGVMGFSWLLIKARLAKLPNGASWLGFYGMAVLCGIGFTMSLFLGTLSFQDGSYLTDVRLGVLLGSLISSLMGALVLWIAFARR